MPPEDIHDQGTPPAPPSSETPPEEPKVPEVVSRAEFDRLLHNSKLMADALVEAGKRLEIVDKVAAMLGGKSEDTLTKEERAVVEELKRLMPHVIPEASNLAMIPKMKQVVEAASKSTVDTLVQGAFAYQLELQQEAGIKVDDPKANHYIAASIKEWINGDPERRARFWRGDRSLIKEGFEDVRKSVIDPLRTGEKKEVGTVVKHRPANAAPPGSSGLPASEPGKLDYMNPKAVREAFKAALAK